MSKRKQLSYQDDAGRRRCLECDAFLAEGARVCRRCEGKHEREIEAQRAAEEQQSAVQAYVPDRYRQGRLARYVQRVLELSGLERLEHFERHPLSSIFD